MSKTIKKSQEAISQKIDLHVAQDTNKLAIVEEKNIKENAQNIIQKQDHNYNQNSQQNQI